MIKELLIKYALYNLRIWKEILEGKAIVLL